MSEGIARAERRAARQAVAAGVMETLNAGRALLSDEEAAQVASTASQTTIRTSLGDQVHPMVIASILGGGVALKKLIIAATDPTIRAWLEAQMVPATPQEPPPGETTSADGEPPAQPAQPPPSFAFSGSRGERKVYSRPT